MKRLPALLAIALLPWLTGCPVEFTLSSPGNGATGLSTTPKLEWSDVGPESGYVLEIDGQATFLPPLTYSKSLGANQTSFTVPAGVLSPGVTYFWRVRAFNKDGQLTASNAPFSFTVGTPNVAAWAKRYGSSGSGSHADKCAAVRPTADGGILVAGWSDSSGPTGSWLLKLTASGTVSWQKRFAGIELGSEASIEPTVDGGLVAVSSTNGDASVLRLGGAGEVLWHKTYGGAGYDSAGAVQQTSDGGFVVAGRTSEDVWVLKLTAGGAIQWQRSYGGPKIDVARAVRQTPDGGYMVLANTDSFGSGDTDIWVLKLKADGAVAWQKTYGGIHSPKKYSQERASSVWPTADGGCVVAGSSSGSIGMDEFFATASDILVFKLNGSGGIVWQKSYGGSEGDSAGSLQGTGDGGLILAGTTQSFSSDGSGELLALKLDGSGAVAWQRKYLGKDFSEAPSIRKTADGGYVVGTQAIYDGPSWIDIRVLKLGADGMLPTLAKPVSVKVETVSLTVKSSTAAPGITTAIGVDSPVSVTNTAAVATPE